MRAGPNARNAALSKDRQSEVTVDVHVFVRQHWNVICLSIVHNKR